MSLTVKIMILSKVYVTNYVTQSKLTLDMKNGHAYNK